MNFKIKFCVITAAWLFCAGCGAAPGMRVDSRGLGTTKISEIISKHWMVNPEKFITSALQEELAIPGGGIAPTVTSMRAAGFNCERTIISCHYEGYLDYKLSGLPKENQGKASARMHFSVSVKTEDPLRFNTVVKQEDMK